MLRFFVLSIARTSPGGALRSATGFFLEKVQSHVKLLLDFFVIHVTI